MRVFTNVHEASASLVAHAFCAYFAYVYDDVTYVTYVYDDVTYVYDEFSCARILCVLCICV